MLRKDLPQELFAARLAKSRNFKHQAIQWPVEALTLKIRNSTHSRV